MSTAVGHPDWQGYAQWVGPPLVSVAADSIPVLGKAYGPFEVAHYRSLLLVVDSTDQTLQINVLGELSGAAGISLTMLRQSVWANTKLAVVIPMVGSRVDTQMFSLGAVAATVAHALHPCNLDPGYRTTESKRVLAAQEGIAVPAGATALVNLPPYAGRYHLAYVSTAATVNVMVSEVTAAGVLVARSFITAPPASTWLNAEAIVGTGLNQLQVSNFGGAPVTASTHMIGEYDKQGDF